ncbi:hypothetical protein [Mastigocoleus testarum]|uniref:Uncharacterized protein n=1 Tax=Mastigocoleus testarum BC008 TaxID=371196 RepID=A0A0V8A0B9_9CYAN|nr:hypothetical protein [Mastigocoleus testarum]KST66818.1 hypothetical protein BC008_26875 [Mastigocoleus testarum BC008]KST70155.1 hypothetical protein BC008_36480 [Mastigocoleus testarum BC008]
MSELALHRYLSILPETALQEFTQWCVLEQAKEAGYEFTPNESKLENLSPEEYIHQLIDQFLKVKNNPIRDGLAAVSAGKLVDQHGLSGTAVMVDFISLYVKYLFPSEGNDAQQADELIEQASQQQFEKLTQIAKEHNVELKA